MLIAKFLVVCICVKFWSTVWCGSNAQAPRPTKQSTNRVPLSTLRPNRYYPTLRHHTGRTSQLIESVVVGAQSSTGAGGNQPGIVHTVLREPSQFRPITVEHTGNDNLARRSSAVIHTSTVSSSPPQLREPFTEHCNPPATQLIHGRPTILFE